MSGPSLCFAVGVILRYDEFYLFPRNAHAVISSIRRRFWHLFAACIAVAALILALLPPEKIIGQVIKIVYLHGALSRAGMIGFWAAALTGALFLMRPRVALLRWSQGLLLSGWAYWTAHFLVSMPATRLTWGPWIAWGEPRVTMTLQIMAAGLIVIAVNHLIGHARFTAVANLLLGIAVLFLVIQTGVLRHPLDPIGTSPSAMLRLIYLLLLLPVMAAMWLTAWRLTEAAIVRDISDHPERGLA